MIRGHSRRIHQHGRTKWEGATHLGRGALRTRVKLGHLSGPRRETWPLHSGRSRHVSHPVHGLRKPPLLMASIPMSLGFGETTSVVPDCRRRVGRFWRIHRRDLLRPDLSRSLPSREASRAISDTILFWERQTNQENRLHPSSCRTASQPTAPAPHDSVDPTSHATRLLTRDTSWSLPSMYEVGTPSEP